MSASLIILCGCGHTSPAPQPPAALSYSLSTAIYTIGVAIAPNVPSSTGGAASSYSVSPALPAELSLDTATGVISGTPTVPTATASYTVTASNAAGSTTAILSITANGALAYNPTTAVYTVGVAIAPNSPSNPGAAVTSYSVSPALPAGLSLDSVTGTISGTPAATTNTVSYTITALDGAGNATAKLNITVDDVPTSAQSLPNMGQTITPLKPTGALFQQLNPDLPGLPTWLAGQAATSVVSPDGNTLLILTSGYNRIYDASSTPAPNVPDWKLSSEYVFVYDISTHTPTKKQVIAIPNTYFGIVFDPSGKAFYVSSGMGDYPYDIHGKFDPPNANSDNVHIFVPSADGSTWAEQKPELALGHKGLGNGLPVINVGQVPINQQVFVYPCAAGLAISKDGQKLVVANYYNDSMTVFSGGLGNWSAGVELDLRPGKSASSPMTGIPGGEYPFWAVVTGDGTAGAPYTAYISSIRDREIDVVNLSKTPLQVNERIPVKGQPNKMTVNRAQTLLYVAEDQSDTVDVINTATKTVVETIPVITPLLPTPLMQYTGANTNSVALSPDETQLYVTNGSLNSISVVALSGTNPPSGDHVVGLIPAGWYPNSVNFSADGTWVYVVNQKSPTGANPLWCYGYGPPTFLPDCYPANEYNPQLTRASFQSFPRPTQTEIVNTLTPQVALNNRFASTEAPADVATMSAVHAGVQHVIFIIKENRTYDQVLGDLKDGDGITGAAIGNGDSSLTQWGQAITPNLHQLAREFVTLDNFMDTAEVSYDGWLWTTAARAPDVVEHQYPIAYAARGLSLDSEGLNRSINVAIPTAAGRIAADPLTPSDPDLLPGQADAGAPDGPNDEINTGYLWDAALRAGLTVRDYGFFIDTTCYNEPTCQIPLAHDPAATQTTVAYSTNVSLTPYTDPYFRGFDPNFPDYYRFKEWEREFDAKYATTGALPNLILVRFMHDHTGGFGTAIDLVNTPELQQADNDYAVALLIQKIANSAYAANTLIFVVEDDSQDGADHVDSHRSPAWVAGAWVKQGINHGFPQGGLVVHTAYNTIDYVRTIEEVLGITERLNLNDAVAHPMADIFETTGQPRAWSFTATPSCLLYLTNLPLPPKSPACMTAQKTTHSAEYWARVTKGLDFTDADRVDGVLYNRILWRGMMGNKPYPASLGGPAVRRERGESDADDRRPAKQESAKKPQLDNPKPVKD